MAHWSASHLMVEDRGPDDAHHLPPHGMPLDQLSECSWHPNDRCPPHLPPHCRLDRADCRRRDEGVDHQATTPAAGKTRVHPWGSRRDSTAAGRQLTDLIRVNTIASPEMSRLLTRGTPGGTCHIRQQVGLGPTPGLDMPNGRQTMTRILYTFGEQTQLVPALAANMAQQHDISTRRQGVGPHFRTVIAAPACVGEECMMPCDCQLGVVPRRACLARRRKKVMAST